MQWCILIEFIYQHAKNKAVVTTSSVFYYYVACCIAFSFLGEKHSRDGHLHVFYPCHEKDLFLNVRLRNYCYCYYYYSTRTSTAGDFLFKSIIIVHHIYSYREISFNSSIIYNHLWECWSRDIHIHFAFSRSSRPT